MTHFLEVFRSGRKWSWRIRHKNGRVLCSSTAQLYSRRTDASRAAVNLIKAAKAGRIQIEE